MSIARCVVRLQDSHGTRHEATVYAETLYEAVVRGLNQLSEVGWESDGETVRQIEVEIYQEPTRHTVDVPKLLKWIKDDGCRGPAEQTRKEKLRKLLGL
jgi:hypothetical protein